MLIWIVLIVLVVAAIAVIVIARWQRMNLEKNFRLEIRNQGNAPSQFELKAEDPDRILAFEFRLAGVSLSPSPTSQATQVPELASQPQQSVEAGEVVETRSRMGLPDTGQAQQKMQGAMGASRAIADVLSSLGMMLPRSIGGPLLEASAQLRRGRGRVDTVQSMPKRVGDQAKRVKAASGSVSGMVGSTPAGTQASAPTRTQDSVPARSEPSAPVMQPAAAPVAQVAAQQWVQTPAVEPGESVRIDLKIRPTRARSGRLCSFSILTRSLEQEDAPIESDEWTGEIGGVGGLRRYHPYALIASIAIFLIGLAFWLASVGVLS